MADLDLTSFLKEGAVADLGWLDVDEAEYRKLDTLPKQNLDIQPDLQALWAREGESPTTYLIPNVTPVENEGIRSPKTMGDMSQEHGRLREQGEEIRKVARLALMQNHDASHLRETLVKRFGLEPLREHRTVLAEVLKERGLLGSLYVTADDFPDCAQGAGRDFVRRYASTARFVLAKKACCGGCSHATTTAGNSHMHCGVFHKEIKVEIPFNNALAESVEKEQQAKGKQVQASSNAPKERIRLAFLAPDAEVSTGTYSGQGLGKIPKFANVSTEAVVTDLVQIRKKQASDQTSFDATPVLAFLHREMVKGLTKEQLARSLKLAFDSNLLVRTNAQWGPVFNEAGLYGVVYTKQASFDDCRTGADFLAKHNPSVRAIVAGEKCGSCIYSKGRCLMYGKTLVKSASEVLTPETVEAVLLEHRTAGRLPAWETRTASSWGNTPAEALKAIHIATQAPSLVQEAQSRMGFMQGFHGNLEGHTPTTSGLTRRNIVKQASRYMNEGLYGQDLLTALKARFEARDLVAAKSDLRPVLAEQGLQGIYYVDPSAYDDFGKGCEEAARLHRTRLVGYVKQGSKCESCVHQMRQGFCSKINKPLVVEPPYVDKAAQQREVLASGSSTDISYESLVNNGTSMMDEYQMQHPLDVEVDNQAELDHSVSVQFGTGEIKL